MVTGVGIILLLLVVSGLIAYIGDIVGRRVGKKRVSLFGLRPKHSSIIVTIITGILIVSITLAVLFLVSKSARTAFFGIQQLQKQQKELLQSVEVARILQEKTQAQLEASQAHLAEQQELVKQNQQLLAEKQSELDDVIGEINIKSLELEDIMKSMEEMAAEVEKLWREKEDLEETKTALEAQIKDLKLQYASMIGEASQEVLYGDILYKKDEPLARTVVSKSMTTEEVQDMMTRLVAIVFTKASERGAIVENETKLLFQQQMISLLDLMKESDTDLMVEIRPHTNVLKNQPIYLTLNVVENRMIYNKGYVIEKDIIEPGLSPQEIEGILKGMLNRASAVAKQAGLIPDPETSRVGELPAQRFVDVLEQLVAIEKRKTIELYTVQDIWLSNQLNVDFRID